MVSVGLPTVRSEVRSIMAYMVEHTSNKYKDQLANQLFVNIRDLTPKKYVNC